MGFFWQKLKRAFELESDLQYTVDWVRECLCNLNAGEIQFVFIDRESLRYL